MAFNSYQGAAKFRKKPVVIEAVQWWPSIERGHFEDDGKYVCRSVGCDALGVEYTVCDVGLRTLEGFMHIKPGYWIITGVKGERYACEPSIFEMTYEPAAQSQPESNPDAKDAARYRFIRSEQSHTLDGAWAAISDPACNDAAMDAAIDKAMAGLPATSNTEEKS